MKAKMKMRIFSMLLCIAMLIGLMPMATFAEGNPHAAHSGYIVHVEAVEGNCTKPGNIEFWYCGYYSCKKCYSDEAMTQEISPADAVSTPGVHSDACVGCEYGKSTKTFERFIPSEHPYYNENKYANNGLHTLTPQLKGFKFLFVGEYNGVLYAMGNETLADGSRPAINLSNFVGEDGSITVDSDTVEFFTYKEIPYTYTFSPDNGYMTVLDKKIAVHGENLRDIDNSYKIFPQSIRFEQNKEMSDYAADKGYLYGWALNSVLVQFDSSGAEPKFTPNLAWAEDENGNYIRDENGNVIDNCAHNIMLYIERCDHPNMKHTKAAEATCTENGAIENWYCEDCKIYFANAEATEYIVFPEGISDYEYYLTIYATGHEYGDDSYCDYCGEIWHPNAIRIEGEKIAPTCFEPGTGAYWYCEDCGAYLDESKENEYWEEAMASKIPALGHAFNLDTGACDHCGLANPVYTKVTSIEDINEEDIYIFVAKAGDKYFVLGGLNEDASGGLNEDGYNEQGIIECVESGNAVEIVPYEDGSISLLNQNYVGNARPSEFMIDIDPEQFYSDVDDNYGLTPIIPKLPNYCVYPFQSYGLYNTGYMGVPRYANGVYGMWDASPWIVDFYTTTVDENTYRDDMDGYTHAEQVARGNIGENISEGDLILYQQSMMSVGGAMFTLRFREYVNVDGITEYYFICGEDWALEGSSGWDYVTDTTPTNDIQYAISLYRYKVNAEDTHTCEFSDWADDENGKTHTGTCKCGKTKTEEHSWDKGVCTVCGTFGIEDADALRTFLKNSDGVHAVLRQDVNMDDENVVLANGSTLDLNGYAITAKTVVIFDGNRIMDSSENQSGSLIVPKDNLYMFGENTDCLPVWDEANNCYILATVSYQQMLNENEDASLEYIFVPNFDSKTIELLKNGGKDTGVSIKVQMTWNNGASKQIYIFSEELVEQVYSSFKDGVAGKVFLLTITGVEGIKDMQIHAVVESSAGGIIASNP